MSVIRKKPEINKIIDDLTDAEKLKLAQEVNNEAPLYTKSLIRKDYYFSELNNNAYEIAGILLEVAPTNTLPGIVIRTNNSNNLREYFIQFAHKQKLIMWRLNTINRTAEVIDEDLDINELRRLVEEVHDHILASEIDSGSATAGQVLSADGEGGTQWANPMDTIHSAGVSEGDVVEIFGFDSEGNLKKDSVPEGIVVDQTIIEDSENAVAGGAVYELKEDVEALQADMEDKANVDGNYPTMTVGAADNLTPYDEDSGVDQEQPFLLQGTGCGNGEQQVDTGALGLLKEKQGNTVVVNQLVGNQYSSGGTFSGVTITTDGAKITLNGTALTNNSGFSLNTSYITNKAGHKLLVLCPNNIAISNNQNWNSSNGTYIIDCSTNNLEFTIYIHEGDVYDNFSFIPYIIDLTQWFGSNDNILAHLLAHPEDFFRYYQGSLAYNEGTLVNANGRYLKTIGRNQWDEEWEEGSIDQAGDVIAGSAIHSKNLIKVIPNTDYYFKVGTGGYLIIDWFDKDGNNVGYLFDYGRNDHYKAPANAVSMKFAVVSGYGTTYNNDITISIYYDGESGYDQYYPYEELANIDTGTETLLAYDYKEPNGTIHRNTAEYTFTGSESWTQYGTSWVCNNAITKGAPNLGVYHKSNRSFNVQWASQQADQIEFVNPGWATQAEAQAATTGMKIQYKLATPTTEQGTTFSENVAIDDFGSMDFGGTSGVPQGASIFYAVDYKAFIDSLYNTLDGDATDIAKESELDSKLATLGYVKLTSVSGYDATKTQVLKNVEGTLTWVTEE